MESEAKKKELLMQPNLITSEPETLEYTRKVDDYRETINNLAKTWRKDAEWRLFARKRLARFFSFLLVFQNIMLYLIVILLITGVFENAAIADVQGFISVLSAATLVETVSIIMVMVKWLFSDIPYSNHPVLLEQNGKE